MIPDGIFSIRGENEKEELYVLEYFADRDNKRMYNKLDLHAQALVFRAIHAKY